MTTRILIIGDSISTEPYEFGGAGVSGWTTRFRRLVKEPQLSGITIVGHGPLDYDVTVVARPSLTFAQINVQVTPVSIANFNMAIIYSGHQNVDSGQVSGDIQTEIITLLAELRGNGIRTIYLCTIGPNTWGGAQEASRTATNTWITSSSGTSFIDTARTLQISPTSNEMQDRYKNGIDNIHPGMLGSVVLGDTIFAGIHGTRVRS